MKFNRNRRRWRVSIAFNILFLSSVIEGQRQLDCNFDQKSFCNWSNGINGVEDDFDWQIDNSVAIDGFHSIPRTIEGSGFFTFAQGRFRPFESDAARAWLKSPTIDGTSRPATLSFVFWKTAVPPVLQICTRDAGDNRLRCLDTISGMGEQRWTQRVISIPGNASPFQIVFVATGFRTALDLVGIDDVTFRYGEQVNLALSLPRRPVFLDSAVDKNWQYQRALNIPTDVVENDSQFIFPTPPVAFETYRPIYNRVQNTFDQESYSNSDSTYLRSGDKLFEKPSFNVHQIPTGRPEVFYVTQSKEYESSHKESSPESTDTDYLKSHEKSTMYTHTEATGYTHTEPTMYTHTEPHYYVTTSHAYSSTTSVEGSHFYLTTADSKTKGHVEPETESPEPCAAVNCFFDTNMCFWYNDLKANFDWKLKAEGSSTRGIISDTSDRGSYAFVNGDTRKREQRAALRSPTLQVPNGAFLDFTTFVSDSTTGHLSLKSSDIYGDKVLWETFGYKALGGHGWNRVRVALPNIKYPLMLILEVNQIATGQFIGLDDLRLTDQSGDDVQCSFNSSMYGTTTGTYSMESQYGKEFYHRSKHTTSPILHSSILLNNVETRLSSFDSNGKYINGEVSVDVLGEHGGSIIKPEIIDASLTTEQVLYRNGDFHAKQSSDFRRLENNWPQEIIRLRRFENLVDKRNLSTYADDIEETDFPLQPYQRKTTSKPLTSSILSASTVPYSQTDDASVDPLGVKDFVRRVGSDLTTLLGINRQSYIFGADVFNRIPPSINVQRNDERNWFRSIFGKKK